MRYWLCFLYITRPVSVESLVSSNRGHTGVLTFSTHCFMLLTHHAVKERTGLQPWSLQLQKHVSNSSSSLSILTISFITQNGERGPSSLNMCYHYQDLTMVNENSQIIFRCRRWLHQAPQQRPGIQWCANNLGTWGKCYKVWKLWNKK